jgi:prepilin-type N-terminal cleavage/methylation domain-containing protein
MRAARRARGFTLIELAVVLAIISILLSVAVPDFIESARNRMAERTARDITLIQDAAKWYFVEVAPAESPGQAHWPGEDNHSSTVCAPEVPAPGTSARSPMRVLLEAGYLRNPEGDLATPLRNPWGADYVISLDAQPAASPATCNLRVETSGIPNSLRGILEALLPQPRCEDETADTVRCSSVIPRPGGEASVAYAIEHMQKVWIPENVFVDFEEGRDRLTIDAFIPGKRFRKGGAGYCQRVEVSSYERLLVSYPAADSHPGLTILSSPGTMYCYFGGGGTPDCVPCDLQCKTSLPLWCGPSGA